MKRAHNFLLSALLATTLALSPAPAAYADSTGTPSASTTSDVAASDTSQTSAPSSAPAATIPPESNPAAYGKNPYTGSTYTHNDVQNGKNIFLGIDVSYHQGTIDWSKVKDNGIQFAVLRLGYRGSSTGSITLDKKFREYAQGASDAGIPIGVYFYTEAVDEGEAEEEANYCLEQIKDFNITLPIAYDFEPGTNKGRQYKAKLSKIDATSLCDTFCATIKKAGYTPMVYANKSDLTNSIDGAALGQSYKIWVAQYNTKTTYAGSYDFWQYSSSGSVSGISGKTDCNFWYSDSSDSKGTESEEKTEIKISSATFSSVPNQTYSGSEAEPDVTVTYEGTTLAEGEDYSLTYKNNIKIGTASVTISGENNFTGSKTIYFNIVPEKVASFKKGSTSKQKTIVLKWAKRSEASGYVLYRKTTYNAKSYKVLKTFTSNNSKTFTNTKLGVNRNYHYAIRAYTKTGGKTYYSDYTYLTAATKPTVKKQKVKKAAKLYVYPDVNSTGNSVQLTIPKNTSVTHLGKLYVTSSTVMYYVKYAEDGITYKGYIPYNTI